MDPLGTEIPSGKKANPKYNRRTYYATLLKFSDLDRELNDTLNRGGKS